MEILGQEYLSLPALRTRTQLTAAVLPASTCKSTQGPPPHMQALAGRKLPDHLWLFGNHPYYHRLVIACCKYRLSMHDE
jgi:hypothetical protein